MPDLGREGAAEDGDAVDAGHLDRVGLRVADPDHARQVGLVAGEPGVGLAVGCPGLAGLARAAGVGGGAGAFGDVVVQQPRHLVGDGFGDDPPRRGAVGPLYPAAGEDDAADRHRVVANAAGGEGRVGAGHLKRRDADPEAADPLRRDPVERTDDPQRLRRRGHVPGADVEVELGEDGVVGGDRRLLQVDPAQIAFVCGVDFPVAPFGQVEVERFRDVVGRVGVDALLDRRRQHEGLEGRSRLAVPLGGEVELAGAVARAGDQRLDLAVAGVDRDEGGGRVRRVGEGGAHRLQPHFLQPRLDRRVDAQPAVANGVDAVAFDQLVFDVVEEVGLAVREVGIRGVEPESLSLHGSRPGLREEAELPHLLQHLVAPPERSLRVEDRVVLGGRLRQPGQHRLLRQVELPDRLGEVDLRGGADADRGGAFDRPVGGDVEVLAEDLLAGVALGVLDRQLRLDDLALEGPLRVADAEVADELLGDRRAALDGLAGFEVLQLGPGDPLQVDAAVLVEALVLDRDRRQLQLLGNAPDRDRCARFVGIDQAELAAVGGVDGGVAAPIDLLAGGKGGCLGDDVEHPRGDRDPRQRHRYEQACAGEEQLAASAAAPPLTSPIALRHGQRVLWPRTGAVVISPV